MVQSEMLHDGIKKVLVTGASGFVGGHVLRILKDHGLRPTALLREGSSVATLDSGSFDVRRGSLSNRESLQEAVRDMDAVIHVAGVVSAPSREGFFEHNAEGTRRLLEAIQQSNPGLKRLVYVSSLAAVGPTLGGVPRSEDDPPRVVSAYGESKRAGEKYVREFASSIPSLIVRPPLVYGPYDRGVLTIARTVARGWMPLLPSEPAVRSKAYSQIYGEDLARGIVVMTLSKAQGWSSGEAFFLSGREIVTQEEIFQTMASALGKRLRRVQIPAWALRGAAHGLKAVGAMTRKSYPLNPDKLAELLAPAWTCSPERASRVFGIEATTSFAAGIQATMDWYSLKGWL